MFRIASIKTRSRYKNTIKYVKASAAVTLQYIVISIINLSIFIACIRVCVHCIAYDQGGNFPWCETSQVLLAGVPGGFSRVSPVSAHLLIDPSHMS